MIDIAEILLKVALITTTLTLTIVQHDNDKKCLKWNAALLFHAKKSLTIPIRKSKNRKHNEWPKDKKRKKGQNNDLQNITQKTKDRAMRTPLKHVVNSGPPEG